MPASSLPLVSATSANALLSDLRPTTLAPQALEYINQLLDELLVAIVTSSESINISDFRTRGVPAALSESEISRNARGVHHAALGALGRAAVGEAEVEIRSWYAGHPTARKNLSGFPPDGKGRGMVASHEEVRAPFPVHEAVELMRVKVASLSTFADSADPIPQSTTDEATSLWRTAGGDVSEETVAPAGLWLTAVLEHICEHILSKLSQVVARDSSIVTANVQDLYTALCEDDSVYGFFKRMDARAQIENHARSSTRLKRGGPRSASSMGVTRSSPHESPSGSHSSLPSSSVEPHHPTFHPRQASTHSGTTRPASEQFYKSVINAAKSVPTVASHHKRASSILSARQPSEDDYSTKQPQTEDDFDAILRSGQTMRVSLTPSRFSTFESSPNTSPQRKDSGRASDHLSAPPLSSSESSLLSMSMQASTSDSRVSGHRAAAGRSWSSQQTKLMPRGPTIEEKDEDDVEHRGQSVIELLKAEPRVVSPNPQERTVPAVILGTPPPHETETVDSENDASPTLVSEPTVTTTDTQCSTSDGGIVETEVNVNGEMFRGPRHRSERIVGRQETRDLAHFLSTTAPPPSMSMAPDFLQRVSPPPQPQRVLPRFKNIMSRMSSTRRQNQKEAKEDDNSFKSWAERTLLPTPSIQQLRSQPERPSSVQSTSHPRESSAALRSQRSHSSVGSASTLHGHASLPSHVSQGRSQSVRSVETPVASNASVTTGGMVLRRASIVRKWAAQVTQGDQKASGQQRKTTPLSVSSPLPESEEGGERASDTGSIHSRPGVGLGLGIGTLPNIAPSRESFMGQGDEYEFADKRDDGTPEAAFATLTAGSKSSPSLSRPSTVYSQSSLNPKARPEATRSVSGPAPTASPRSVRAQLRHERVAELREADDAPPVANGTPSSPTPSARSLGSRHSASPVLEARSLPPRSPSSLPPPSPASSPHGAVRPLPPISPRAPSKAISKVSPKQAPGSLPGSGSSNGSANANAPVGADAPPQPPIDGYVALADLTPLRNLLDHATTARECQLLLDAILSQIGVPRAGEGADRVAAWLLAGSPMSSPRTWTAKVTRKAPAPPSEAPSVPASVTPTQASSPSGRSSRRRKLHPEVTNKSLPALPGPAEATASTSEAPQLEERGEVWDISSEPGEGEGVNGHAGGKVALAVPKAGEEGEGTKAIHSVLKAQEQAEKPEEEEATADEQADDTEGWADATTRVLMAA